jgi:lysophospholipase L1-like esterase
MTDRHGLLKGPYDLDGGHLTPAGNRAMARTLLAWITRSTSCAPPPAADVVNSCP